MREGPGFRKRDTQVSLFLSQEPILATSPTVPLPPVSSIQNASDNASGHGAVYIGLMVQVKGNFPFP